MMRVAQRMRETDPGACIRCAFLELCPPDLTTTVADLVVQGVGVVTIFPMFLGLGKHAREDLPRLAEALRQRYPEVHFVLKPSVGEEARVIELLAQLALDRVPPAPA